jgi:hypothetical protein
VVRRTRGAGRGGAGERGVPAVQQAGSGAQRAAAGQQVVDRAPGGLPRQPAAEHRRGDGAADDERGEPEAGEEPVRLAGPRADARDHGVGALALGPGDDAGQQGPRDAVLAELRRHEQVLDVHRGSVGEQRERRQPDDRVAGRARVPAGDQDLDLAPGHRGDQPRAQRLHRDRATAAVRFAGLAPEREDVLDVVTGDSAYLYGHPCQASLLVVPASVRPPARPAASLVPRASAELTGCVRPPGAILPKSAERALVSAKRTEPGSIRRQLRSETRRYCS